MKYNNVPDSEDAMIEIIWGKEEVSIGMSLRNPVVPIEFARVVVCQTSFIPFLSAARQLEELASSMRAAALTLENERRAEIGKQLMDSVDLNEPKN